MPKRKRPEEEDSEDEDHRGPIVATLHERLDFFDALTHISELALGPEVEGVVSEMSSKDNKNTRKCVDYRGPPLLGVCRGSCVCCWPKLTKRPRMD